MKHLVVVVFFTLVAVQNFYGQQNSGFLSKSNDSICNMRGVYLGGGVSHATVGSDGFVSIGYVNEFNSSNKIGFILAGNIINSIYEKSVSSLTPTVSTYGIQLSFSAEARTNLNSKNSKLKTGWFIGLPIEFISSYLNTDLPFDVGVLIAPSVGYKYVVSDKLMLEAAGGIGLALKSFKTLDAVPYVRLKACYTL